MGERQQTTTIKQHHFRFEPYDLNNVYRFTASPEHCFEVEDGRTSTNSTPPTDIAVKLHTALEGRVEFVPYPTRGVEIPVTTAPNESLVRLFIGQLPYGVTDMQLAWLCRGLAGNRPVYNVERIIKWNMNHQPKGCVHAYCHREHADDIIALLNRRVLFDDSGVWCAKSEAQRLAMEAYCKAMKEDPRKRFRDRPYQPVVVQLAHSTFVLRRPSTPPPPSHHHHHHHHSTSSPSIGTTAPPAYGDTVNFMHQRLATPHGSMDSMEHLRV